MNPVLEWARHYQALELSVIPIRADGSKAPPFDWKEYQQRRADDREAVRWWGRPKWGIAVICGQVSGCLEVMDFDHAETYQGWAECLRAEARPLWDALAVVRTPAGGAHVYYRLQQKPAGNTKLARDEGGEVLIETRGEGGYVLAPGCPPECHPDGGTYELAGDPAQGLCIPQISLEGHDLLWSLARSFDRLPPEVEAVDRAAAGLKPGEDFDLHGPDWSEILTRHGWVLVPGGKAGERRWRRPGKSEGWSATTGRCKGKRGEELLRVFSSNARPFQEGRAYGKFRAIALLEHGGDLSAAARSLRACYGGGPVPAKPRKSSAHELRSVDSLVILEHLSHMKPKPVDWLWRHWIPRGSLTLLDGDPGLGKSTLSLDLACRVSRGWRMPPAAGSDPERGPAGVLLLSAEDSTQHTIRPRVDAAGGDAERIFVLRGYQETNEKGEQAERPPELPWDLDSMAAIVEQHQVLLLVVDPFMAYLSGEIDAHKDQDVRRCLHRLALFADKLGLAVLVLRHLNKLNGGPALYRGGGSIAITGAARCSLIVGRSPTHPDQHVLAMNKTNLGPRPQSLAYSLDPVGEVARVGWIGPVDLLPDDILTHPSAEKMRVTTDAVEVVRRLLRDGPMSAADFEAACKAEGLAEATVKRARKQLGVLACRAGFGSGGEWSIRLPDAPTIGDH